MIKALLFDLDGTLADTETLATQIAIEVCKGYDISLTVEEKQRYVGLADREFYRTFFRDRGVQFPVDEALQKQEQYYEEALRRESRLFAEVSDMLYELKEKGYKLALVTGSNQKQVSLVFGNLVPFDTFNTIVTTDDVSCSKPNPEGYILAMKKMGVTPPECIAIEESATGIKAARAADLLVVGIRNLGGQDISGAHFHIRDIKMLRQELKDINKMLSR